MDYMRRALSLAAKALGDVSPNPAVGAVIVKDGVIVGEGCTQPPGQAHAEIMALRQAGEKARGATLWVTLEPCCHHGRTPPCTQAVIKAGIAETHMAIVDPNPVVSGKGKTELDNAGIRTFVGEHEQEAREINEAFIKHITTGMPFVTAKFAMSLDGKIATRSGDSKWISGEASRRHVHQLRRRSDAIMVGVNTVLKDDPQLTARCDGGTACRQPLRVIVDSQGRTPEGALALRQPGKTLVAVAAPPETRVSELTRAGAEVMAAPSKDSLVDLEALLKSLGRRQITSVLVEGGATLLGSLFDLGLVDKVVVFVAPVIIGGERARTAVGGLGVDKVADALRLTGMKVKRMGNDIMVTGSLCKATASGKERCSPA